MNINERICFIKEKYFENNQSLFAKSLNISPTTISNYTIRNTKPSSDFLELLLNKVDSLNARWLLTGEGDPLRREENALHSLECEVVSGLSEGIPLYRSEAAAGFGTANFAIEEKDIEARYKIRELSNAAFMLHVRGDSMSPTYQNGDIIAVKKVTEPRNIQWGKPHLVSTKDQGLLVKRIYNDEENSIIAISDNPTYRPMYIRKEEIDGIGIIIGCVKLENY